MAEEYRTNDAESETTVLMPIPSEHPTQVMPATPQAVIPLSTTGPATPASAIQPVTPATTSRSAPGWYPDPWASGQTTADLRYFDGTSWTAHLSGHPSTPKRLGVPGWVLAMTWVLVALVASGVFFFVLVFTAFACDSGWEGCSQAAADGVAGYVVVTALLATVPPLLAVVIARGRRLGRVLRILALVIMPLSMVAGFATTLLIMTSRFPE